MSQSQHSFLEEVVQWNSQQCLENLTDALPKLLHCLDNTKVFQEQVGILKIVCQSFLPCVEVINAEEKVYRNLIPKASSVYDSVEGELLQLLKSSHDRKEQAEELGGFLQLLVEILDCCESCVNHAQKDGQNVELNLVHSLPEGTIHFLQKAYSHCKDSGELYGEDVTLVSEQLSFLFKKAHSLQVTFLHLLEKIQLYPVLSEQDVQDLSTVCEGLFEVCRIVTSLDIKLVVTLWKAVSKQASMHKEHLKTRLNVGQMVAYLCTEIQTGFQYLFHLLPQLDSEGMVCSQGDEKGFQKSVKILGFQMKICAMLIREYSDYIYDCELQVYQLLIHLHKSLSPSLCAPKIQQQHDAEIRRQLLNATDSIVSSLLVNKNFMCCFLSSDRVTKLEGECLAHLLLLVTAMDLLPKAQGDIQDRWMSPATYSEDEPMEGIVRTVFELLDKCSVEFELPIHLPGPMCEGKPQSMMSLYQFVCVHLCGFVGSLPARKFQEMEEILLQNILSGDHRLFCLASDVLCFISRYGSADLCYSHVTLLMELSQELPILSLTRGHVASLINRLVPFIAPQHQEKLIQRHPVQKSLTIWSDLKIQSLSSQIQKTVVLDLTSCTVDKIQQFMDTTDRYVEGFMDLIVSLKCLLNVTCIKTILEQVIPPSHQAIIVDKLCQLWASILVSDWLTAPLLQICLGYLMQLTAHVIIMLTNNDLIKVLSVISAVLNQKSCTFLKLSVIQLLQQFGKVRVGQGFEEAQVIQRLPDMFSTVLTDREGLVHQSALHSFTQFAEETPHESVVTGCVQKNSDIQQSVVNYLNKVPISCASTMTKQQYLADHAKRCENVQNSASEDDTLQPSSKRQRTEEPSVDNTCSNEVPTKKLLEILQMCVTDLQGSSVLTNDIKSHLKIAQMEIENILGEAG